MFSFTKKIIIVSLIITSTLSAAIKEVSKSAIA